MIIKCPNCGNLVSDKAPFCPNCNTVISKQAAEAKAKPEVKLEVKLEAKPEVKPEPAAVTEPAVVVVPESDDDADTSNVQKKSSGVIKICLCALLSVCLLGGIAFLIYNRINRPAEHYVAENIDTPQEHSTMSEAVDDSQVAAEQISKTMLYANAYDGFVNIRETPTSKGNVVGQFRNGPEGAVLIDYVQDWVYINYKGIVGYVYSKYVSSTPTKEVTIAVDGNWLKGVWRSSGDDYAYLIFNNGTYMIRSYSSMLSYGTYMLEENEIVFDDASPVSRFVVDVSNERLGYMTKYRLLDDSEADMYRGELRWTKSQYSAFRKEVQERLKNN